VETATPPQQPRVIAAARPGLDVSVRLPGSKSISNRAFLLAALADGVSTIEGALSAGDTLAFAAGLRALGFDAEQDQAGAWRVRGGGGRIPRDQADVHCAEAGTAARFLVAACAAGQGRYRLDGAPQLRRRPLAPLLQALRAQGAATEPAGAERLPFTLLASGLAGGGLRLPGDTSSQFVSALLMAAPAGRAPLELQVEGLVSRPYVDMTLAMMAAFGVPAGRDAHRSFSVQPGTYRARSYVVEPDASTASYFFAAAALTGGSVRVPGLRRRGSLQGDVRFLDVLEAMGCRVEDQGDGTAVTGPVTLLGVSVDMSDISDTFMTLAALAPFAASPVTISGIGNVRLKESDRIAAMQHNLQRLGVRTEAGADSLRVFPGVPAAGRIDPHDDHRIAMAFAVLGLRVPGLVIEDPGCVAKTCPGFFELWTLLERAPA
jgi:3-phosphoshikimate 1-carboxyvinyltransferase